MENPDVIIAVDDDQLVLYLHQQYMLEHFPHARYYGFSTAEEAEEFLLNFDQRQRFKILLLLDVNMPVSTGWELLEHVAPRFDFTSTAVIIVTSSLDPSDQVHARQFPMVKGYYEKPIDDRFCTVVVPEILQQPVLI